MLIDRSHEEGLISTSAPKTYVAFVLDKSGSMKNVLYPTINGFNKQLETIHREANENTKVSLVTFSTAVMPIFFNRSISRVPRLDTTNYQPNGWTALYDAVGYTIRRLENEAEYDTNTAFLVVIVSDGQENRSIEFNQNSLASLIKQKQSTGKWSFVYIGSNQDLSIVQNVFNIPANNVFDWVSTPIGTDAAYAGVSDGLSRYLVGRSAGLTYTSGFFNSVSPTVTESTTLDTKISSDKQTFDGTIAVSDTKEPGTV